MSNGKITASMFSIHIFPGLRRYQLYKLSAPSILSRCNNCASLRSSLSLAAFAKKNVIFAFVDAPSNSATMSPRHQALIQQNRPWNHLRFQHFH
jgi:hypothetical protein